MVGASKRPWSSVEGKRTLSTSQDDDDDEGLIEEEPPKSAPLAKKANTRRDVEPHHGGHGAEYSRHPSGGGPKPGYYDYRGDRRDSFPPREGRGDRGRPMGPPGPMGHSGHGPDPRRGDRYDHRGPSGPGRDVRGMPGPLESGIKGGRGGGPPPGWRGDDRRAPPHGTHGDRDKYYHERDRVRDRDRVSSRDVAGPSGRGRVPPVYNRGGPPEGRGRDSMNADRGPEYSARERGPLPDYASGGQRGEGMDLLAHTRGVSGGSSSGGRGLMFGRRGAGTPGQAPGWGRGEGGYGAPPDRRGTSRDGVAPASRGGAKSPGGAGSGPGNGRGGSATRVRREKVALNDKEVYDQVQLQMMLLEYHSTLASLELGVKAKINPVSIPYEAPPAAQAPPAKFGGQGSGNYRGAGVVRAEAQAGAGAGRGDMERESTRGSYGSSIGPYRSRPGPGGASAPGMGRGYGSVVPKSGPPSSNVYGKLRR